MTGLVRRVRAERDLWRAVWQQVEAFLDRIDAAADQDADHVRVMAALLPVVGVIERARRRAAGYGLAAALPISPRGVGLGPLDAKVFDPARLPGADECELAVASYIVDDETGELGDDPRTLVPGSVVLATFRDEAHAADLELRVPAYDFGPLASTRRVPGAASQGLFPLARRKQVAVAEPDPGESFALTPWSALRGSRLDELEQAKEPTIAASLAALPPTAPLAAYRVIGLRAAAAAGVCREDRRILQDARAALEAEGEGEDLLGRLSAAANLLAAQAGDYDWAAARLLGYSLPQLLQARPVLLDRLVQADRPGGGGGLPGPLQDLDDAAAPALDTEIGARVSYPDGPLRMQRLLEQALRLFWNARKQWMTQRFNLLTRPLLARFFAPFVDSFARARAGQGSGLALPAQAELAAVASVGARELRLSSPAPSSPPPLGRLIHVGGDRPTAAAVLGVTGGGARLATTPLAISVEVGAHLPGLPGVIPAGAPVSAAFPPISDAELRRGRSASGPAADGLIEALIRHGTQLALVLGRPQPFEELAALPVGGGGAGVSAAPPDRPHAPPVPAPYPALASFAVVPPVDASATRLVLAAIPPASASGTGEPLPAARPGELILLRGADAGDQFWQAVAEVDRCEVVPGAQVRAGAAIGDAATPPCCPEEAPVMVVHVRSLQLPGDVTLTRSIALHRDFRGFGLRSLLARAVLPLALDPETATVTVLDGAISRTVLRDPELRAAVSVLEDWLGAEGGAPP